MKRFLLVLSLFCTITITNAQWMQQTNPGSFSLMGVFMVDEDIAYAVGGTIEGNVIKTTDGGENWQLIPSFTTAILFCVWFVDEQTGFVAGQFGTMFKTSDGGVNWLPVKTGTNEVIEDTKFLDANTGFACGTSGMVIKTTDGATPGNMFDLK